MEIRVHGSVVALGFSLCVSWPGKLGGADSGGLVVRCLYSLGLATATTELIPSRES